MQSDLDAKTHQLCHYCFDVDEPSDLAVKCDLNFQLEFSNHLVSARTILHAAMIQLTDQFLSVSMVDVLNLGFISMRALPASFYASLASALGARWLGRVALFVWHLTAGMRHTKTFVLARELDCNPHSFHFFLSMF